jgi:DNA-binding NarL/FixJ family response regulator/anti-sigma regulatory factor (Ser/Thr protein kinase)
MSVSAAVPVGSRTQVRVLVVDDNDAFRASLVELLQGDGVEVVGQASSGAEAIELSRSLHPDVVLMDLRMPDMDGIETTRRLKATLPEVGVVALTGLEGQRAVQEMLVAGASGYVLKDSDGDEIVQAIKQAASGGALLAPAVTPAVIDGMTEALERERRRARQLEVAQEALLERAAHRQELLGRLGHELRTPVTVILGLAQALKRDTLEGPDRDEALATLVSRAEGLAKLVARFEAAVEAGLTEWADVTALARDVAQAHTRVKVEAPDITVMTRLNRTAGARILAELVENALAFSPEGSDVIVRITSDEGHPEVRVMDRGPGVDPEAAGRIFEPLEQAEDLYTRTHQGVGIGLSLARLSARAMDGDVVLESSGPGGSTFLWRVAGGPGLA